MEARFFRAALLAAAVSCLGASYRTKNFIVTTSSPQAAEAIGRAAEKYRRELAVEWLGEDMPGWAQPCPITAHVADHLGAGGATSFLFEHGEVFGWRMTIQGSLERILDSVLPHEVTHTIFATHFRQPLPRWADEGACTTVEHQSERAKQQVMLVDFLRNGRGIAFNRMFAMTDYPQDVMPLYSQGYSVARYLISQGGKRKFLDYLADGMSDKNWTRATTKWYGFSSIAVLQTTWNEWVREGSPSIEQTTPGVDPDSLAEVGRRARPQPNLIYRAQNADHGASTSGKPATRSVYAAGDDGVPAATAEEAVLPAQEAPSSTSWRAPQKQSDPARTATQVAAVAPLDSDELPPESEPPAQSHEVTRPQAAQRKVILEWSRNLDAENQVSRAERAELTRSLN